MDAPSYLQQEARNCLHLAQIEQHSEMKVILMGMALGWLSFARQWRHTSEDAEMLEVETFDDEVIDETSTEPEEVR